jgi:hypothetical protein
MKMSLQFLVHVHFFFGLFCAFTHNSDNDMHEPLGRHRFDINTGEQAPSVEEGPLFGSPRAYL